MLKILYLILLAFGAAVLSVAFLPNLTIFGASANLAVLILGWELFRPITRDRKWWIAFVLILGLTLDLLTNDRFLAATLSLLVASGVGQLFKKIVPIEDHPLLAALAIFSMTLIFDSAFMLTNRIFSFNFSILATFILESFFTAGLFLFLIFLFDRLRHHRPLEMRIK